MNKDLIKNRVFHVISNTHWDREWRFPFQRNRQMLVEMIDKVLEILEAEPDYRAFHLDSQSVVLNDYLEIRPEKEKVIKRFVQEKRLLIGPWFILPEEFQVGGENLIRNLLLGHKICSALGGTSKIGYSPFSWGQISQLPQIYKGFGIDVIMFYRGVNSIDSKKAEFIWEGADGTRSLSSRFSTMPRYNFYFYIYRPVVHNEKISDAEYKWSNGGTPFHFSDKVLYKEDYFITKPLDTYFKENIIPSVNAIVENQVNDFTTENVIWMEGHDSSGPNIKTVRIIKDIKELIPEMNIVHSTLEEYSNALKKSANQQNLTLVKGERRSAQNDLRCGNLFGYTTSARMYLKQKNFEAENWIQFYAEPFNSICSLLGLNINDKYLERAWYYILENSAHDSIGGCSLDEVHDDMMFRYKQSIEISKGVFERACKYISTKIDLSQFPEKSIHLVVVNPTNYIRNDIVEAFVDVPTELDKGAIEIIDQYGKKLNYFLVEKKDEQPVLEQLIDRPLFFRMKRYHCYIELNNILPFGITSYYIKPVKPKDSNKQMKLGKLFAGLPVLENEYLKIKIGLNGTLDALDKITGKEFYNLAYLYDEGEAGHAWINKPIEPFVTTLKSRPKISFVENNSLVTKCSIKYELHIFPTLEDRSSKSKIKNKISVEVLVSLKKNSRRIDFQINVDNNVESHRLRIMFPTGIPAEYSYGEGQFDVVERSIKKLETKDWIEQPMYDYPMHHFVDVSDGKTGAAVIVKGLKEYEVLDNKDRTIAITLLRAFKYIIQPSSVEDYNHQKGSQCLGKQSYKLAFYPHQGDWHNGKVYEEALCYNTALRIFEMGSGDKVKRGNGEWMMEGAKIKANTSFFQIQPKELVFSCFKKSEDGIDNSLVLRLYNPTNSEVKGKVNFLFRIKKATEISLEELPIAKIKLDNNNSFQINVGKKKIATYKIEFDEKK
ncbi:MAG: glycosyl hydrolase-related protein [Ignavibacteriales bacterium]|nr:glycosyl hydrolase-related protein [Ignavibacteriales bacterium]